MADALISDLSVAAALANADLLELEQGVTPTNSSRKVTLQVLAAFIVAGITFPIPIFSVTALSISAGVVTIDLDSGRNRNFTLLLNANVTSIVFTNLPSPGFVGEIEVEIKQDETGSRTVALPAAFKALGGSDTSISLTANSVTVLSAKTFDQGATWRYAMQESA